MNNKEVIVFDADGLLLFWLNGMINFLKEEGLSYEHLIGDRNAFYSLNEIFQSDDEDYINEQYQKFLSSDSLGKMGRFCDGSLEVLNTLSKKYILVVLTCIGRQSKVVNIRKEEIESLYPGCFSEIYCIDLGESKQDALEYINDIYNGKVKAFIDDRSEHVHEAEKAGVKGYQFIQESPPLRIDESVDSIRNWSHLYEIFK